MKKYLALLVAPLLLTGCFNDEPNVAAPVEEAAVVEDVNTENEAVNEEVENTDEVEVSEEDADSEKENDDEKSQGTNSTNESSETNSEETSNAESAQTQESSTPQRSTKTQEDDAIEAVKEYAEFEDENYTYLTHLEENGEWLQVEVRDEMADQNQTNLVALFRRHLTTKSLEEFDFIEGDYLPVE